MSRLSKESYIDGIMKDNFSKKISNVTKKQMRGILSSTWDAGVLIDGIQANTNPKEEEK